VLSYIGSYLHNMQEQRVRWWKQRATYGLGSIVWSSAQSRQVPKQEQFNGFEVSVAGLLSCGSGIAGQRKLTNILSTGRNWS